MLKIDFKKILDEEVEFHGKRFLGENEDDKQSAYKRFLIRYYESLSHASESSLIAAFKKCRENYEYFPKISHLLKFCPPPISEELRVEPKYVEPSEAVRRQISLVKGSSIKKVGEVQLRKNAAHCAKTWPNSNWDEPLKRWLEEDKLRK